MPQFAKFEITRTDAAGNPISGATIVLRKQGATVVSGGPTSFTVDDPGAVIAGDTVNVYSSDGSDPGSAAVSVSSITATNVTVGGGGFSASNNDRISPSTALPTMYKDAQGDESTTPLTTDTNGYASAWIEFQPLDVVSTGGASALGAAATHIWFDVYPSGIERVKSTAYMDGTAVARRFDTLRALTSGDRFVEYRSAGAVKWYVDVDGSLNPRVPAHTVAGTLTVSSGGVAVTGNSTVAGTFTVSSGGVAVTGNSTITGTLGGLTGLTVASGTVSLPAGQIGTAELADNSTFVLSSADGTTDQTLTTAFAAVTGASIAVTPVGTNSKVLIEAMVPFDVSSGVFQAGARLLEDATVIAETQMETDSVTDGRGIGVSLVAVRNGFAGTRTYTIQVIRHGGVGGIVRSATTDRKARIVTIEFAK